MKDNSKGFALIVSFFGIAIILAFAGGGWWAYQNQNVPTEQATSTLATDETAGWKTYRNEKYGFEFGYLSSEEYREDKEGGDFDVWFKKKEDMDKPYETGFLSIGISEYHGEDLKDVYIQRGSYRDFSKECETITFVGVPAIHCAPIVSLAGEKSLIFSKGNFLFEIFGFNSSVDLIESRFKFTK